MMKKFNVFFLFLIFFFLTLPAFAINDLTSLCSGGRYDYCSQAPKCGEYPEWNAAWEQKSRELWDPVIFEYCQKMNCQGYVPLCCYEMVRTKDPDKCAGYDTLYCLPSQCDQVPGSYEKKSCAHGAIYYCPKNHGVDARSIQPIPLSQRFQNDVLFYQIEANPTQAASWVPTRYPDIWNLYQRWKTGGTPTNPPTTPTAPNTPTKTYTPNQPTTTPNQPTNPPRQPTNIPPISPTTSLGDPYKPNVPPTTLPPGGNPPAVFFKPPAYYPPKLFVTQTPYYYNYGSFFTSPLEKIKETKNKVVNKMVNLSKEIYTKIVYFTDNYLP